MTLCEDVIVSVRCLGNSAVEMNGAPIARWRLTKAITLFHYLLDRRGHVVDRTTLTETFWPDQNAQAPEISLKVAVHGLRRTLRNLFGPGSGLAIETHSSGYLLHADGVWYDVEEFERAVAEACRLEARGRTADALERYRRALALYRGDFLAGASGDWILRRRLALVDQRLLALTRLAEAELTAGDYQACVSHCLEALDSDPCRERTYQLLMLCHAELGQFGRVRAWRDLCEQTLRTTLDTSPSVETEQLFQRLYRQLPDRLPQR